jgi:uncharacterized protein (TIGR03435 family)
MDVSMEEIGLMRGMRFPPPQHEAGPAGGQPGAPAAESTPGTSIFTSIQQLGLKLEPKKAPVDLVVVDRSQKVPTEN